MGSPAPTGLDQDEQLSPRQTASAMTGDLQPLHGGHSGGDTLDSLDLRADPDAQAAVTDFLDFTEYLPSDIMRSLTLIGKLDQTYSDASERVHGLTTKLGKLPTMPSEDRPAPAELRSEISESLGQGVNSRVYAHVEAVRMAENVNRHYNRARTILEKLQTIMENYPPPEELKSPVASSKSPQASRTPKLTLRVNGQRVRRPQVPIITVPGEVLAPYELTYEDLSSGTESSSEEAEEPSPTPPLMDSAPQPRIKLVKTPKAPKALKAPRARIPGPSPGHPAPGLSTSSVLAQLQPPPENAVIGSPDAPWLQLTIYELAKLRKRMKKNAAWAPSDTMIARELKNLGRGIEAYRAAQQKAEEEGRVFEHAVPAPVMDAETGVERLPPGALNVELSAAGGKSPRDRKAKPSDAQRMQQDASKPENPKQEELAKLAAEEAEESARKMANLARAMFTASQPPLQGQPAKAAPKTRQRKRKRESVAEVDAESTDTVEPSSQRPQFKRTKTETPVPPPQLTSSTTTTSRSAQGTPIPAHQPTSGNSMAAVPHSTTPVPVPIPGHDYSGTSGPGTSPAPSTGTVNTTEMAQAAVASTEAAAQRPAPTRSKSTTPGPPPVRETRKTYATRKQEQQKEGSAPPAAKPLSRAVTPAPPPALAAEGDEGQPTGAGMMRRPGSRGKTASQEPQPSFAAERSRRASTARNTPAPERQEAVPRPGSRRARRPAPGVISRTNSGGSSAVGRRKAAPRKKSAKASKKAAGGDVEVEVDDEGNVIDPDEPRYCLCNRVSFGVMIKCDNVDCKLEWFHLECVGLTSVPARTTKWYCPECRVLLNIGEKGEVNARGIRM